MAEELDLTNPSHVAELLRSALPGFVDQTPEVVAEHIDALRKSDHQAFSHIGVGERVEPNAPVDQDQDQDQFRAKRGGWSEIDRHQSKGKHEVYQLRAKHLRSEPIIAEFTGECQAVRVTLPRSKPPADGFVGTWIGTVEVKDHLAFSIDEIEQWYARAFQRTCELERVDLITGARFRGRRFSPVSIYLAYPKADGEPSFYFLEGGSASGNPEAMYCARDLSATINQQAGFRFTPFACDTNWYEGGLELSVNKHEPACVYLSVAQTESGQNHYLRLSVTYDRDRELRRVIHPFELQIEAAMRVLAIAEQAGCELGRGQGGALEHSLGPLAGALLPWDERPKGTTTAAERARYCGCPR